MAVPICMTYRERQASWWQDTLVPELITAQAGRTPDAVAVRQWQTRLSYAELLREARQLAAQLRGLGVGPEARVGICARRTPAVVVAMLAVWLAGGAYVPLDPGYPRRRLRMILDDSAAVSAIADETGQALLGSALPVVPLSAPGSTDRADSEDHGGIASSQAAVMPGNAAYVIYTSGSTGRPKGVVVSHGSVAAFARSVARCFPLDATFATIGFAALAFDVSVLDIVVPLCYGGSVQLIPDEDRIDPARLQRFLEQHRVTWGVLPPAVLPLLDPARLADLTDLLTAGEPPGPEQVERWSAAVAAGRPPRRFHNWYGPTETTVCVTGAELAGSWDRPLPIGAALPGCAAYVVNDRFLQCPVGTAGELCIGGPQLARGYLGQAGQTAERFVADPFSRVPGARLYRTGDQVILQPDGSLAFLGRLDRQVKIRGQRVEIGEIEAVLLSHHAIRQAVVDTQSGPSGDLQLVAYLTPAAAPDLAEVRAFCLQRLPGYMTPARVVAMQALPLSMSGKIDLAALRALAAAPENREAAAAQPAEPTLAEAAIDAIVADLWTELLGPHPGPAAADFISAGGNSLLAMRLVSGLRARTGRHVTVEDVLAGRTVSGIAARLAAAPTTVPEPTTAVAPELSSAQRRIWFVEQVTPGTPVHNIALAQRLRGSLDLSALRAALREAAAQQEVLRWQVREVGGDPAVTVAPSGEAPLLVDDLTGLSEADQSRVISELLEGEATAAFTLATGPLWRARLIRLGDSDHVLGITVHHLVFDGWSQDVLYREICRCYESARAGQAADQPARGTFAHYVAALRGAPPERASEEAAWWVDHLADAPHILDLPRDRPRPTAQSFTGAATAIELAGPIADRVAALAGRTGATQFTLLIAAFTQLLRRLTGQRDLIVGTPFADRKDAAYDDVVGLFLQILPLRLQVIDHHSFIDHLGRCRDEIASAFAHVDAPLEQIVDSLDIPRDLSRSPLIQVMFNCYNFTAPRLDLPGIIAEPMQPGLPGSLFDLTVYVSETAGRIQLRAVYSPDLFDAERIDALLASYAQLLDELTAHPDLPVSAASMRPSGGALPDASAPLPDWHGPGVVEQAQAAMVAQPHGVAVSGPQGLLRYEEVAALSRRTVTAIRAAGVRPGTRVAVVAAHDIRLSAILLGLLAAGARWAVLDPATPPEVLARRMSAVHPAAIVRFAEVDGMAWPAVPVIEAEALDCRTQGPDGWPMGDRGCDVAPAAGRGYLSLTSGTTATPVLVETTERPLAHFLAWYAAAFGLGQSDRFALLSGLGHDPALRDLFTPLVTGGLLCVPEHAWLRDPARLTAWLRDEQVTVAHLTPQLARVLTAANDAGGCRGQLSAIRLIALAGDQTAGADIDALRTLAPAARIVNYYGTTETPQAHAWYDVTAGARAGGPGIPVGWGIEGSQLLVVTQAGRQAAVGELGEVVIRSRYLATGYTDPELTSRRFTATGWDADDRQFRTGDLGRYLPDGAVMLAGRSDDQVKIRGFRVELAQVESVLLDHPGIQAVYVTARA